MKTDRLLGLLSILANTDKITAQELANRFEVSKRTIFRDLDTLSRAGIPIFSYSGIGGGVSIMDGYKLKNQVLSTDDIKKIFTALNGLKSVNNDDSIKSLIAKLVPENETAVFSQSDYVIDLSSWFSDSTTHEKAIKLHQAISQQKCVRLEYISKKSRQVRLIEPHKLVFKQSYWYIYAFCQERNDFRLFKLNRIVSLEILETQFQLRQVNNIEFGKNYGENLFSADPKADFIEVVLEYDTYNEFELTDKIDASFFKKEKEINSNKATIHFYTSDLSWTANYIWGFIDKVKILSPPELNFKMKERLEKINTSFKG